MNDDKGTSPSRQVATEDDGPRDRRLDLEALVHFVDQHWRMILLPGLLLAAVAWIIFGLLATPTYQAAATLVVLPPKFSSRLKPEPLNVQGYQRLLESDAVVAETARRLAEENLLPEGVALRVGDEIRSRIFVSRRAEETALAPVIEALALAGTPDGAALTANTWAVVFLDHTRNLRVAGLDPTIELIESQYAAERQRVEVLSEQKDAATQRYKASLDEVELTWRDRLDEAEKRWSRRLLELERESEERLAAFQVETRALMEAVLAQSLPIGPPLPDGIAEERPQVHAQIHKVATLRIQLAQTPQRFSLAKAITDDALWTAEMLLQGEDGGFATRAGKSLITEELNPVHAEITSRLHQAEIDLEAAASALPGAYRKALTELERRQRERSAGLSRLLAERKVAVEEAMRQRSRELEILRRERDRKVAELVRQRDSEIGAIDRDLQVEVELVQYMAKENQQAMLARSERDVADVRLGSRAVPPLKPRGQSALPEMLAGLLLGCFLGAMVSLVQDVHFWLRERDV